MHKSGQTTLNNLLAKDKLWAIFENNWKFSEIIC